MNLNFVKLVDSAEFESLIEGIGRGKARLKRYLSINSIVIRIEALFNLISTTWAS